MLKIETRRYREGGTMAYTALYRKWRPTKFEDVRGQEPIVRTLKNQLIGERIGHAYLFNGTRGTGKTTVAKIFARAVNCEHPVDGSPCNECPTCKAILSNASVNVVEIDAASNNGVDNIREIREEVRYKPTEGKYRVYIIDEVHMLSTGAFNALLKTLEEPPAYVIFILATTEVHKIPITVLSRCQRYDFKRLPLDTLKHQITDLLHAENVEAEEKAIAYIARQADGSSRDALSLLEQCISFYYGETLSYENVLEVLGAADQTVFSELLTGIQEADTAGVIGIVDRLLATGRDLNQFAADFSFYLRNLLMIQAESASEETLGISKENMDRMRAEAENMDINQIIRYIRMLGELMNRMRYSGAGRVLLEVTLIEMMQSESGEDIESLKDRIRRLEERIKGGVSVQKTDAGNFDRSAAEVSDEPKVKRSVEVSPAGLEDCKLVSKDWREIVESEASLFRSIFSGTTVSAKNDALVILFKNKFNYMLADNARRLEEVKALLEKRYGRQFAVSFTCLKENEDVPEMVMKKRLPGIEMDIEEGE